MTSPSATTEYANPATANPASARRWRRRLRRLAAVALVFGCIYFFRGPILRQIGAFLVVQEPAVPGSAILVFEERGTLYDEAGGLYSAVGAPRRAVLSAGAATQRASGGSPSWRHHVAARTWATGRAGKPDDGRACAGAPGWGQDRRPG